MGTFEGIDSEFFFIPCILFLILMCLLIFLHYYSENPLYKKTFEIIMILISNLFSIYIGYMSPILNIGTLSLYYIICIIIPFSILYSILEKNWHHKIQSESTATTAWLNRVENESDESRRDILNRQRESEINRRRELDEQI
tara:strand:- start:186 stop:608 length:423 start_codon:yes stop_codon:yes gene_type:complete